MSQQIRYFSLSPAERASCNAQQRIESHGYIRNLENEINNFGGKILDIQEIKNPANIDNPTFLFHCRAREQYKERPQKIASFALPGSDYFLEDLSPVYFPKTPASLFPKIFGMPILRVKNAILATQCGTIE